MRRLRPRDLRRRRRRATCSGRARDASPDAFTVLHDAFLAGGAFITVPAGVVVDRPIVVAALVARATGSRRFPHTLVVADESSEVTVVERFGSPDGGESATSSTRSSSSSSATTRTCATCRCRSTGRATWQIALQRAHVGRDASLRSSAVALGGDYARLRSESLLDGVRRRERPARRVLRRPHADARLPHAPGPRRAAHPQRPAVQGRGRGPGALGVLGPRAAPARRRRRRAYQTNRNLVLTEGAGAESIPNLEIEANDVRCSHASAVGPIDDDQLYYLESRGIPPEEAERLIVLGFFDDVFDAAAGAGARPARCGARVIEKIEHRRELTSRVCAVERRRGRVGASASTSTATGSASCASATTGTSSATSARTRTTRSRRATCGRTSARSSARSTGPRSRSRPASRRRCRPRSRCRSTTVRVDGDDVVVTLP